MSLNPKEGSSIQARGQQFCFSCVTGKKIALMKCLKAQLDQANSNDYCLPTKWVVLNIYLGTISVGHIVKFFYADTTKNEQMHYNVKILRYFLKMLTHAE